MFTLCGSPGKTREVCGHQVCLDRRTVLNRLSCRWLLWLVFLWLASGGFQAGSHRLLLCAEGRTARPAARLPVEVWVPRLSPCPCPVVVTAAWHPCGETWAPHF